MFPSLPLRMLALVLAGAGTLALHAQSQTWRYAQNGAGLTDDVDVIQLADGGMVVFGEEGLVRLDDEGAILWQKNGAEGVFVDMIERSDGSLVALSYDDDAIRAQITLFNADGTVLRHMRRMDDTYPPAKERLALLPDDGFATFEGLYQHELWGPGRHLYRFDADGDLQWTRFIEGGDLFSALITSHQGHFYGSGGSELFRLAADGNVVWGQMIDPTLMITDIEVFDGTIAFAYKTLFGPEAFGVGVMDDDGMLIGLHDFPGAISGFEVSVPNVMLDVEVSEDRIFLLAEHVFLGDAEPSILFSCDTDFGDGRAFRIEGDFPPVNIHARADGRFAFAAVDQYNVSAIVCKGTDLEGCYPMAEALIVERVVEGPTSGEFVSTGSSATWTDVPMTLGNAAFVRSARCASVGLPESALPAVVLSPNPANDQLHLDLGAADKANWRILDGTGRLVRQGSTNRSRTTIDVGDLGAGPYVLGLIISGRGTQQPARFVVVR